jgi:hypothetical protein
VLYLGVVVVVEVGVVSGAGVVGVVEVGIVSGGGVARAVVMTAKNEDNVAALELALEVVVEVVIAVVVEVVLVSVLVLVVVNAMKNAKVVMVIAVACFCEENGNGRTYDCQTLDRVKNPVDAISSPSAKAST